MDLGLRDKFALVTGGTHGIGRSIALTLAEEGCHVAVCSRTEERVSETVKEIKEKGVDAIGLIADVLVPEDINMVMSQVQDTWGTLHVLVNNVGGGGRWGSESIEETPLQVWLDVYSKNALAAVNFTTQALPWMRKQQWGRVICISSITGREGGGRPWYNMAKCSEISLMKSLAMNSDLVRDGITFNSVAPGRILISGTGIEDEQKKNPVVFQQMLETLPMGRLGLPVEVASTVAFLCSEQASFVNGACIPVDGAEGKSF